MSHFETALELEPNNAQMLKLLSRSTAMMNMEISNAEYDSEEDDFVDLSFWKDDEFTDDELNDDGKSPHAQSHPDNDNDDEIEGPQLRYKKGFIGEKIASVIVIAIDLQLKPREGSYYIDENSTMYLNAPSSVACHPKKPSKVEEPDRVGGPCPGFVLQPLPGRPSVPCPYRILCRNTTNSTWNKSQWLKCHGCMALQNNLSTNVIWPDKSKLILSNISARMTFVSILLTHLLVVL